MIRMGRTNNNENTSSGVNEAKEQPKTNGYQMQNEVVQQQQQQPQQQTMTAKPTAISESESMARDIKEGRLSGFVGAGTVLTGETNFNSMLRIDGHLTGRVTSEDGTLIVGSTGQVDANIEVASAIVNGMINGDIVATEKLELGRTARVVGNIKAPRLILSDGAILEGSCSMIKSKETMEQRTIEEKMQYTTGSSSSKDENNSSREKSLTADNNDMNESLLEIDESKKADNENADAAAS